MSTESWDELAEAVLTHDPELQHIAWHTDTPEKRVNDEKEETK